MIRSLILSLLLIGCAPQAERPLVPRYDVRIYKVGSTSAGNSDSWYNTTKPEASSDGWRFFNREGKQVYIGPGFTLTYEESGR